MIRYLTRKIVIYLRDVRRRGDDRLGDPADDARRPDPAAALAHAGPAVGTGGADRLLHEGLRLRRPALEAVPQLLGRALPRRPRPLDRELPDDGLRADHGRAALHAGAADPGRAAQLLGREQGRRARRPPQVARQHGAAGRLRADRDAADVARDRARVGLRQHDGDPAGVGRLQPGAAARVVDRVRRELPEALDPPVLGAVPRRLRRLGDRDAQHDHLRARGRLLELPRRPRRAQPARAQVRLPQRAAAADHRPRARAGRGRRRRDRGRDRLLVSRARVAHARRRSRTATTS